MTRILMLLLSLGLALSSSLSAAPARRRAAIVVPPDVSTPRGWLALHASPFATVEPVGDLRDLEPLRQMIGTARVVGLGDGTHGTSEYYTSKLRMIRFLVQEMGFDLLAVEGNFGGFHQLHEYAMGGPGSARELLLSGTHENYYFWQLEEFVAVIEWIRSYNISRGSKPAVQIVGIDTFGAQHSRWIVLGYLSVVDPGFVEEARAKYSCAAFLTSATCMNTYLPVYERIRDRREDYVARSSAADYENAFQAARVLQAGGPEARIGNLPEWRNEWMARHTLWALEKRSQTGKIMVWAHQEHLGRTRSSVDGNAKMTGMWLEESLGSDYFVFGNATWEGSFLTMIQEDSGGNRTTRLGSLPFGQASPESYEAFFREAGQPRLIIPLRGITLHPFLAQPRHLRGAGATAKSNWSLLEDLAKKFDAVIFIEQTTAAQPAR